MAADFFNSTFPYIFLSIFLVSTVLCTLWSLFPRHDIYNRVGEFFYFTIFEKWTPGAKLKAEPNDRKGSKQALLDRKWQDNHRADVKVAVKNKREEMKKTREQATTVAGLPTLMEDVELDNLEATTPKELV